jgi:hypothetical protein
MGVLVGVEVEVEVGVLVMVVGLVQSVLQYKPVFIVIVNFDTTICLRNILLHVNGFSKLGVNVVVK